MNKYLSILITCLLTFSACNSIPDTEYPDMPEAYRTLNQETLDKNLEILKDEPENTKALFEVAYRNEQLGYNSKAIKYYKELLDIDPTNFTGLNNLSLLYEELGMYQEAAVYVKRLYENNQADTRTIEHTVRILLAANDPLNAQHALENFTVLKNDDSVEMTTFISNLYEQIQAHNNAQ